MSSILYNYFQTKRGWNCFRPRGQGRLKLGKQFARFAHQFADRQALRTDSFG
jgi:hypothetical protein